MTYVEALLVARKGSLVKGVGGDGGEEVDLVIGAELAEVIGGGQKRAVDVHFTVEAVVDDEVVGHLDADGFHWMALAVIVLADCWVVEIAHSSLSGVWS